MTFVDAAMYSSGTPSTVSIATRTRTSRALTFAGVLPVSMLSATVGRDESARTLGEVGAVQTTMRSLFQWNPMGITRGTPSCPLEASRAGSRSEAAPARRGDEAPEPIPLCSSQSLSYPVWATSPALRARHGHDVPQYFSRIGMAANRFAGAGLRCGQSWSRRCRRGLCPLRDPMIACSTTKPIRNSPAIRPLTHSVRPAAPTTASTR
jgi:hypothetical protein